jgi:hypothetical protein
MDKSIQGTNHRGIKEYNPARAPARPREREREKKDKGENGTKNQATGMKGRPAELSKSFQGQRARLSQGFHLLESKVGNLPREGGGSKEAHYFNHVYSFTYNMLLRVLCSVHITFVAQSA